MRAMLKDSGLPNEFWPEAVESDVYLRNRTATGPEFDGQVVSPIEAYTGQQPSIDHIRVWGCKVYTYMNPKSLPIHGRHNKLMDRGRVGVFLSYMGGTTKNYKVWVPDIKKVIVTSNVNFSEGEKGGSIDLKLNITNTSNQALTRNPVSRPTRLAQYPASLPDPVQRVFSHVSIPKLSPEVLAEFKSEPEVSPSSPQADIQTERPTTSAKRPREDDNDHTDEPLSKHLRALMGLEMDQDWDDFEEMAMPAFVKEYVPILRTYYEAVTDPE
jgi:hypothetical protein